MSCEVLNRNTKCQGFCGSAGAKVLLYIWLRNWDPTSHMVEPKKRRNSKYQFSLIQKGLQMVIVVKEIKRPVRSWSVWFSPDGGSLTPLLLRPTFLDHLFHPDITRCALGILHTFCKPQLTWLSDLPNTVLIAVSHKLRLVSVSFSPLLHFLKIWTLRTLCNEQISSDTPLSSSLAPVTTAEWGHHFWRLSNTLKPLLSKSMPQKWWGSEVQITMLGLWG